MQNDIDEGARYPAADHVDGVVRLNIHGGKAHQHKQWQHAIEQQFVTTAPGQNHEDCCHPHMTAGEGGSGLFTRFVSTGHTLVEETVAVAWHGQWLVVSGEEIMNVGEYAMSDVIDTCGQVIILWSRHGQEYKYHVIDEERREDYKHRAVELLVSEEEVI